mmetsp:Transcript_27579/g.43657  ORF Transcript_27579/g.43657 Transcript_27579/m.43657 type:complete len:431 (-) Transcript_27579:847-2139(-)
MRIQHRMKPNQPRSHKGYISIPVIHSTKRRNGAQSPSSESSSSALDDANEKTRTNTWWTHRKRIVTFVVIMFVVITTIIYMNAPAGNAPFPRENIRQHALYSTRNNVLSPHFSMDETSIASIPQTNPLQIQHSVSTHADSKMGIVYFLEDKSNLCALLLSMSSVLAAAANTSSAHRIKFQLIVFVHYQLELDKLELDAVASSMNFQMLKYELNGKPKMEYMIRRLKDENFDAVIYVDAQSFVLRDLSVLFAAISADNNHFSGIWSFQRKGGEEWQPCLSFSVLAINVGHIKKYDIKYSDLFRDNPLCVKQRDNNFESTAAIEIGSTQLSTLQGVAERYGIVAVPWWYVMDHEQFALYYGHYAETQNGNGRSYQQNGRGILSWFFQSTAYAEVMPILIDLSTLDTATNDDTFLSGLTSIHQKAIDFCQAVI